MAAIKTFRILRQETPTWNYVVQIEDDRGNKTEFSASFEDLDRMSIAIDEEMLAIVEAAGKLEAQG